MRKLIAALVVATSAIPVSATVFHYTLQNVTFTDGGTGSGSFDYDTSTHQTVSAAITTTAGSVISGYSYTLQGSGATQLIFQTNESGRLSLVSATNGAFDLGGTVALRFGGASWEASNDGNNLYRNMLTGSVTTDVIDTPEPAMLGLFGLAAVGLGLSRRRKA